MEMTVNHLKVNKFVEKVKYVGIMFFQPSEEQSHSTTKLQTNHRRRRKKNSNKRKQRQLFKKKQSKLAITMSSWTDDFITAATWQMKHQIAYWKSKARALEYENRILHEIIRENTFSITNTSKQDDCVNSDCDVENDEENEDDNFEVSEEFIEFLTTNAKYKEDARKERERLRANINEETNEITEGAPERKEDGLEKFKELYGRNWQRVAAREISLQCDFIENTEKYKPLYWPNIPLNFNFS